LPLRRLFVVLSVFLCHCSTRWRLAPALGFFDCFHWPLCIMVFFSPAALAQRPRALLSVRSSAHLISVSLKSSRSGPLETFSVRGLAYRPDRQVASWLLAWERPPSFLLCPSPGVGKFNSSVSVSCVRDVLREAPPFIKLYSFRTLPPAFFLTPFDLICFADWGCCFHVLSPSKVCLFRRTKFSL